MTRHKLASSFYTSFCQPEIEQIRQIVCKECRLNEDLDIFVNTLRQVWLAYPGICIENGQDLHNLHFYRLCIGINNRHSMINDVRDLYVY